MIKIYRSHAYIHLHTAYIANGTIGNCRHGYCAAPSAKDGELDGLYRGVHHACTDITI